jgi:hypothetical protein
MPTPASLEERPRIVSEDAADRARPSGLRTNRLLSIHDLLQAQSDGRSPRISDPLEHQRGLNDTPGTGGGRGGGRWALTSHTGRPDQTTYAKASS